MPLQKLQRQTTSTEFVEWIVFLREEHNENSRNDILLASIVQAIRQIMAGLSSGNKEVPSIEQIIPKFETKYAVEEDDGVYVLGELEDDDRPIEMPESARKRMEISKSVWMGFLGMDKDGKPKESIKRELPAKVRQKTEQMLKAKDKKDA